MYMEKELRSAIPKNKFDFDMKAQYACAWSGVKTIGEINHINIEDINRKSPFFSSKKNFDAVAVDYEHI